MDFYKRVEHVSRQIPKGSVATYGQIALLCGKPQGARQVGFALSHRVIGNVPAHRIVNAKGYLSGAGSFETPDLQKKLLRSEKVYVNQEECVDLKKYGWKHTYDDALFFLNYFNAYNI